MFGAPALDANLELTRVAPDNEGGWTRLARCYMEAGRLDDATAALDAVLRLNSQNSIARSLLGEVSRRRAAAAVHDGRQGPTDPGGEGEGPEARQRQGPGADRLVRSAGVPDAPRSAPAVALDVLGPRLEALLMALNERPFAAKIADARNKAGSGVRLFRRGGFATGAPNQIVAVHYGGAREPQISVALTSTVSPAGGGRDSIRAGLAFQCRRANDANREDGRNRALAYFAGFQQLLASQWQAFLTDWLSRNGGAIQIGRGAARDRPLRRRGYRTIDVAGWHDGGLGVHRPMVVRGQRHRLRGPVGRAPARGVDGHRFRRAVAAVDNGLPHPRLTSGGARRPRSHPGS